MSKDRKYRVLAPYRGGLAAAFALIAASHVAGAADAPVQAPSDQTTTLPKSVLDERNWTSAQRVVFKNIETDLHRAGIPSATYLNPFPVRPPDDIYVTSRDGQKTYEGYYTEMPNGGPSLLVGVARQGLAQQLMMAPPNATFQCPKQEIIDSSFFENLRILDYVHEAAHRVSYQRHLTDRLKQDIGKLVDEGFLRVQNPGADSKNMVSAWKADLAANIDERQADATLALYVKSNLPQFEKELGYLYNRRVADVLKVDNHDTASSIDAASAAYDKAPRRNISIIEAAEWARDILAAQKQAILSDYLITTGVIGLHTSHYGQMSKGAADQTDQDVRQRYNLIRRTEERLCGLPQPRP